MNIGFFLKRIENFIITIRQQQWAPTYGTVLQPSVLDLKFAIGCKGNKQWWCKIVRENIGWFKIYLNLSICFIIVILIV